MTIAFEQTGRQVVFGALKDLGIVGLAATPRAAELAYGLEQLNLLVKGLAAKGATPWAEAEDTVTFGVGVSTVELDPRPLDVLEARLVVNASYQRPLTRWGAGEYDLVPNKAQSGVPLAYEVLRTPTAVSMRVWPVPTVSTTIAYSYSRVIEDVTADDPLDVPQMWGDAIREMLKARLTAFGPVPAEVQARALMLERELLDYDRPDSYFIEPDRYA